MTNINKYWLVLEKLHLPVVGDSENIAKCEERLRYNIKELEHAIKLNTEEITTCFLNELQLDHLRTNQNSILENAGVADLYCLYALKMIKDILQSVNLSSDAREDLVSETHKTLIIACIEDVALHSMQENLHGVFYKQKGAIFKKIDTQVETNFFKLELILEIFSTIVYRIPLYIGNSLNDVLLSYMAGIFSLLIAFDTEQYELQQIQLGNLQSKLQMMWLRLSKKMYFRNLMLLYSTVPNGHKSRIHREMLLRLWSPGGFTSLLFAMVESKRNEEQSVEEMVGRLVAQPSYSTKAQQSLIKQILEFLQDSLKNRDLTPYMGAGIVSLRKLYDNKTENKDLIIRWLRNQMLPLIEIDLEKVIAMEWLEFTQLISLIFHIFCTSSVSSLPSELLIPYVSVFIELHSELLGFDNQAILKNHLSSLILKTLNNRSNEDLKNIMECLALQKYPDHWYQKHSSINIKENPIIAQELKLSQSGELEKEHSQHLTSVVFILKHTSYNLLTYKIFIMLFQLVPTLVMDNDEIKPSKINLLESDEDNENRNLKDFTDKYERKFYIIQALESLVQHQPLKSLIHDNISDILKTLQAVLNKFASNEKISSKETNKTVLMILLILIREIIEIIVLNQVDFNVNLYEPLKQLELKVQDDNLKYQIKSLLKLLKGETACGSNKDALKTQFEEARLLIESKESYLQVEGIEKMMKLLKQKDEYAVVNCHVVTALALNTLKSPESYTFLNCVRLFVSLVSVNESEVLELLSDEYLNEASTMDYRLIIGEAIVKVSRELGSLCYKYKTVLLNTFLSGCRSPLNEFRLSSYSNVSQMCRILTYQVHNFFQELLHLVNCELTTGEYLPTKRAAALVLSDLLTGMDNLLDYEEMLLPIYRLLKHLVSSNETDEKIRIHASNGLSSLTEKCKELFQAALKVRPLEKEIKIMSIRDQPKKNFKNFILELN